MPVLMWPALGKGARNQALVLLITGGILVAFAAFHGVFLGWQKIFTANLPLLAMFVAVSFLALTNSGIEGQTLPQGKRALAITAFGTHLLGAVINLSVLFVFGDRLRKNGVLTKTQAFVLARSFCSAAWWSPFFVATGVALTYAPGMSWHKTLIPGAVMSLLAIGYSIVEVSFFKKFLSCWAISTASSPLSGVGLALVSRYQVSPKAIIQSNWFYATMMWATACTVCNLFFLH
ncbi:hypothetical protein [uncultured Desulfobacter sp.]|uniref:hypothetical protein n=1 Tax=uncultured Desulfobacter sp. TaxID=240139 RepID=UPI0029F59988|nr:hypothetical protein [uncultured Desulfobacter sp.]